MAEPLLTKRLHVSGLTPSLTPADLERRLSLFGKVKAIDGFGARDALGDPRKFGFVTLEISARGLEKCLNALSGTMWKGAKLRIGEAKPDFRERLAQINAQPPKAMRPRRMYARNSGRPSSTLPLTPLSSTAAASTPGWITTSSGRVVRPMRMRPVRPLDPMRSEPGTLKVKGVNKVRKRVKPPPVRARRRIIDPTKWDSVYLKGVFLDNVPVVVPTSKDTSGLSGQYNVVDEGVEGNEEEGDANSDVSSSSSYSRQWVEQPTNSSPKPAYDPGHTTTIVQWQGDTLATSSQTNEAEETMDIRNESNVALAIMDKMFEGKEDWDGRESVDELESEDNGLGGEDLDMRMDEEDGIEIVPCDSKEDEGGDANKDKGKGKERSSGDANAANENGMNTVAERDSDVDMEEINPSAPIEALVDVVESAPRTDLRALFAPREEVSFSLLEHLDLELDLEFETDILGIGAPSNAPQRLTHQPEPVVSAPNVVQMSTKIRARSRVTLDPSRPVLFPSLESLPHSRTTSSDRTTSQRHGALPCFLFSWAAEIPGLHALPLSITFTRSPQNTPESIRERWEKDKSLLTHEWKRAWREAKGNRRGRAGTGGDTSGSY